MLIMSVRTVYPETAHRSLESIDALFSTNRPFNWDMERAYRQHWDVLGETGQSDASAIDDGSEAEKAKELVHGEHV